MVDEPAKEAALGDSDADAPAVGVAEAVRAGFGQALLKVAERISKHYVPLVGLLTLVAGGFYILAYSRFYSALGITPEEAGLSTPQILAHSVVGGLALVVLASLATYLVLLPAMPVLDGDSETGTWQDFRNHAIIAGFAAGGLVGLVFITGSPLPFAVLAVGWVIFATLITGLEIHVGWPPASPKPLKFETESYVAFAVAVAIPAGLFIAGFVSFNKASELGEKAGDGQAVLSSDVLGLPFLGVRAETAVVTWKSPDARRPMPNCVLYLGTADGQDVLYDHRSGSVFKTSSDGVVLQLRKSQTSCEAPVNLAAPRVRHLSDNRLGCSPGRWRPSSKIDLDYRWTMEGIQIPAEFGGRSPIFDTTGYPIGSIAHCHVTASGGLGSDTAMSGGIVIGETP